MMSIETQLLSTGDPDAISAAVKTLNLGNLIVLPTDTVYGLACLVHNASAIERLFAVKERSPQKAIAVLLSDVDQLGDVTEGLSASAKILGQKFWPGALTLIVKKLASLPAELSPTPTIGVRIPDHTFARSLLRLTGPLATTSANLSGNQNTQNAQEVLAQLNGRIHLVLDGGAVTGGVPSTVVDCTVEPPVVLRAGAISSDQILSALS